MNRLTFVVLNNTILLMSMSILIRSLHLKRQKDTLDYHKCVKKALEDALISIMIHEEDGNVVLVRKRLLDKTSYSKESSLHWMSGSRKSI